MADDNFIVPFRIPYSTKNIEVSVNITYRSKVIIKLTITAESKTAQLEKYLFRRANQWKTIRYDPAIFSGAWDKRAVFEELQKAIDNIL